MLIVLQVIFDLIIITILQDVPHGDSNSPFNYHPHPVDMTNLTLSREMQNMAERLAENAQDIWAQKKMEELATCGGKFNLLFLPLLR